MLYYCNNITLVKKQNCYLTSLSSAAAMRLLATESLLGGQNSERYNCIPNNIPEPPSSGARSTPASTMF